MTPSIVTSTSASFGIALVVVSEPKSAMRRTPGQLGAVRTKERTPRSRGRRVSATEGVGPWDRFRFIWFDVLRLGANGRNWAEITSGIGGIPAVMMDPRAACPQ